MLVVCRCICWYTAVRDDVIHAALCEHGTSECQFFHTLLSPFFPLTHLTVLQQAQILGLYLNEYKNTTSNNYKFTNDRKGGGGGYKQGKWWRHYFERLWEIIMMRSNRSFSTTNLLLDLPATMLPINFLRPMKSCSVRRFRGTVSDKKGKSIYLNIPSISAVLDIVLR